MRETRYWVVYKGEYMPLQEALDIETHKRSKSSAVISMARKRKVSLQEYFETFIENRRKEREKEKIIEEYMARSGRSRKVIMTRMNRNLTEKEICSYDLFHLRNPNGTHVCENLMIEYNGELLPFKTACLKATNGATFIGYTALMRVKIYKGMTPQQAFDKWLERRNKRWQGFC